jgi:hypothetical protein
MRVLILPCNREFEPQDALQKAMVLFWRKGYLHTSLDDLVSETEVSRYGLYSTFGEKHALFNAPHLPIGRRGCLICNTAVELVPPEPLIELRITALSYG